MNDAKLDALIKKHFLQIPAVKEDEVINGIHERIRNRPSFIMRAASLGSNVLTAALAVGVLAAAAWFMLQQGSEESLTPAGHGGGAVNELVHALYDTSYNEPAAAAQMPQTHTRDLMLHTGMALYAAESGYRVCALRVADTGNAESNLNDYSRIDFTDENMCPDFILEAARIVEINVAAHEMHGLTWKWADADDEWPWGEEPVINTFFMPPSANMDIYYTRGQLLVFSSSGRAQYYTGIRQPHIQPVPGYGWADRCDNTYYFVMNSRRVCSSCGYAFTGEEDTAFDWVPPRD
jgi:hypothetical protein